MAIAKRIARLGFPALLLWAQIGLVAFLQTWSWEAFDHFPPGFVYLFFAPAITFVLVSISSLSVSMVWSSEEAVAVRCAAAVLLLSGPAWFLATGAGA